MAFNSYTFILFFGVVLLVYYTMRSWAPRKRFLLAASYVFYAAWSVPFAGLLVFSTVLDWIMAQRIYGSPSRTGKRTYLVISLIINLGLLALFKYHCFFLENIHAVLAAIGFPVKLRAGCPDIILPVGISFYTFQTLSYTLDVYLGRMAPWHSFSDYALYVTFFPQLVAGPVVRAPDFLPQCTEPKSVCCRTMGLGLFLMALGLFQKTAIADGLLAPVAEGVYDNTVGPTCAAAWIATVAFAGQILCDFGGYSTCAIGAAMCLGFRLPENFRFPYAAVGFSDFWRRWHISLSSWFRDYLYIPLGGSRGTALRTSSSLMVTMLLVGLWHGATWSFVVWGGIHGLYLIIERTLRRWIPGRPSRHPLLAFPLALLTFACVCVAWVFFRADSFSRALLILKSMFGLQRPSPPLALTSDAMVKVGLVMGAMLIVHWVMRHRRIEEVAEAWPWWIRSVVLAGLLVGIVVLSGEDRAFIYFQF